MVKFKHLSKILCDELGCPPIKFFLPINLAERITARSVYNLKRNNRFDYSKAERELCYTTIPLEETLRDEAKWLRENGHI